MPESGRSGAAKAMKNPVPSPIRRSVPAWCIGVSALVLSIAAVGIQARHHASRRFDYYLMSLSWAPTYCLTHTEDGAECSGKGYGFVLHGLWPQDEAGGYPERCATQYDLSADAIAKGRTVYPSERLMQHEWQEHGACTGLDPRTYFETADRATATIRIPAALEAPRSEQDLTADDIIGLFRSANPGIPEDSITIACNRDAFSEVRVCLTKDLHLRGCGRGVSIRCPRVALRIPASR